MSDVFGGSQSSDGPADGPAVGGRSRSGRSRVLLVVAIVLVTLFIGVSIASAVWTEKLWFDSLEFGAVYTRLFWTRIGLFVVFGLLMGGFVLANLIAAWRTRPVFRPASVEQNNLDRYREAVMPIRFWLMGGVVAVMAAFAGTSAAGQWREFMLWRNGTSFGRADQFFGRDIGFYVFDLPWWHYVVDFTMAMAIVGLMAAALTHYLLGGIRLQGSEERLTGAAQVHLSLLLGMFVLAKAVDYWLDRFDLLHSDGLFTGIGYTDDHAVLPAKNILVGVAVICALLFLLNVWRRSWLLPTVGLGLMLLSSVLVGMIWPQIVQQFQVSPTEGDKEAPYLNANIGATRTSYGIDGVEQQRYGGEGSIDATDETEVLAATKNVPVVDPEVARSVFETSQQQVGYYTVGRLLDLDHYNIDGNDREMVVAARELDVSGVPASSRNWANLHTVYTHGYGLIGAFANQRPADEDQEPTRNAPEWSESELPPQGAISQEYPYDGRIYYGENSPSYSIVGKAGPDAPDVELDLPSGSSNDGEQLTTYDGEGGVSIGGGLTKFLYAVKFGEPNLLLSERVNDNSKILYDREPREMVEKVAPWLTVDGDPFPTVVDGRIQWVLDGYTTTDKYPQAQRTSLEEMTDDSFANNTQFRTLPTDEVNYMRNAVKATVDAYDGTVTLYAWDEQDPMLQAWRGAFPGTVKDKSEIPPQLLDHLRYPEDLFKVQRYQLARYHVTDAADFYTDNRRWELPPDPYADNLKQPPLRLSLQMPGQRDATWSLSSMYTPYNRKNVASFLSVGADASDEENYGKLRVLDMSGNRNPTAGPVLVANQIQSSNPVKRALRPFTQNNDSRVVYGKLSSVPVADGLLYTQPIYTVRGTGLGNPPSLEYVVAVFGGKVGIGGTLPEAVAKVLGTSSPDESGPGPGDGGPDGGDPGGEFTPEAQRLLDEAQAKFEEADRWQRQGETVKWAEALEEAQSLLQQALAASAQPTPDGGQGAGQPQGQGDRQGSGQGSDQGNQQGSGQGAGGNG